MTNRFAAVCVLSVVACLPTTVEASGMLIADGGFGGELRIQEQDVDVVINNGIAVTTIDQTFLNTEDRIVEALYTFPVPKGASVSNFSMWINGNEMIGEVVEKKRAREIYESYKQTRRDPGLLEQVDFKRFEMRVFPIAAGAEQRVRITYYQELDFDHDWATYVYPLATTSEESRGLDSGVGDFSFSLDVRSEVPIVEMKSPSHGKDVAVSEFHPTLLRASLELADTDINKDVVISYQVKRPMTGIDVIGNRTAGEDGYLQLTMTIGEALEKQDFGMDYVFVLDVSGSMRNDRKLAVSGTSVAAFIENLSENDRFELITFNDIPAAQFGELMSVDDASLSRMRTVLKKLWARGGTSLQPAIETAYRYNDDDRPLNVVILSDGMTEQNESSELMRLIRQRPAGARVFAVGVGNDVNRPLLQDVTHQSGGLAAFLSGSADFTRQAEAFRRKLLRPAIEDVRVTFAGKVYDIEPESMGNLYHGAPARLYARYQQGGPTDITISGSIMGTPFSKTATIDLPERGDTNPELERMWAWHRVQGLMQKLRSSGNSVAVEQQIVELCEEYSIISEYASFIVLENDAEYRRWRIERRNVKREGRDRAARARVQQKLDELRQQAMANLGPGKSETTMNAPTSSPSEASPTPTPGMPRPTSPSIAQRSNRRRGFDLPSIGGGGGGGALDPFSGTLLLSLGALGFAARNRRREDED